MKNKTVYILKYFIIGLIVALSICDIKACELVDRYIASHASANINRTIMLVSDYALSAALFVVLFTMLSLVNSIIKSKPFTEKAVRCIGIIELACAIATIISLLSSFSYYVYVIICLAALLMTLISETLRLVFISAANMKNEMDLVI